ncbi:MAG: PIN domain-containing protein [Bacteroidetes bacterium]|nr:PIN domain-containing protein [Bacteroidota bacterium]MBS1740245.1 PIN domain-containing protein [Bacteroidota bacterium]
MKKLIITDTNVFFDIMSIEILPDFFGLDFEICTTDFVINEIIRIDQAEQVQTFIRSKKLTVYKFTPEEVDEVISLKTKRNLRRITDKSVMWKALQLKCRLLTGDKNLKNEAEEQGLQVNGSLWVIKMLVENRIITSVNAAELLEKLKTVNEGLPKDEIEKLIKQYR